MMSESEQHESLHIEKHRHADLRFLERNLAKPKIVLAGNPNVGKSAVFNALSRLYVDVSNYPGTTVEVVRGSYRGFDLYDTPGIYGISSFNEEERVARDIILEADIVVNVVNATHLECDLFLTQQLIDMGKRVIVLLNFMDDVKKNDIRIDVEALKHFFGVDVIPFVAVQGVGLSEFEEAVGTAREGTQREELHAALHEMLKIVGSQAEALLVMEGDEFVAERHGVPPVDKREEIYICRRNRVNYIVSQVLRDVSTQRRLSDTLGRWAVRPLTGIPMILAMLYLVYLFVGKLVAQDIVGFTEKEIGHGIWEPWLRDFVGAAVPPPSWLNTLLVGEFGVLTLTTTYLVFLLLPLVASFYFALAIMEDSGYLPRLATLADRLVSALGLNGKSIIPLILGFGCVTSATIATRVLGSERERTIATAILQFAIPCSAQLAVIAALLAGAGFFPMLVYSVVILSVFVGIGTTLHRFLKGEATPLFLDLPPMRLPRVRNVARKMAARTYAFMTEAAGWFFLGALAVAVMQLTGALEAVVSFLTPLTTSWLQLPAEASRAFVMGVVRRDFGAAGLYHMTLTSMQITVALITITLFVPCIASLMVMIKERGWKEGVFIWIGTWIAAFLIGGLVSQMVI
jgi:ferrous iron transport protein B